MDHLAGTLQGTSPLSLVPQDLGGRLPWEMLLDPPAACYGCSQPLVPQACSRSTWFVQLLNWKPPMDEALP